jgi:preprotein translocase subunit SecD
MPTAAPHPYVYVNAEGTARELHANERQYLETEFRPGDGAQPGFDQRTNEPIVTFRFNAVGAREFGRVTGERVGAPMAVVLDGVVLTAPIIREPILGGTGQISGNFSAESANDLAMLLRSGALPAPLTIVEERTLEP